MPIGSCIVQRKGDSLGYSECELGWAGLSWLGGVLSVVCVFRKALQRAAITQRGCEHRDH